LLRARRGHANMVAGVSFRAPRTAHASEKARRNCPGRYTILFRRGTRRGVRLCH
jgi:hypothetical protein